ARHCPACRRPARSICGRCLSALPRWAPVGEWSAPRARELGLDGFAALFVYAPPVARVILAAKNGGRHDLLAVLGHALAHDLAGRPDLMSGVVGGDGIRHEIGGRGVGGIDVVTWVPASRRQARRRGYDQGRELAGAVARPLGLRARPLLRRAGREAQAGRNRVDRLAGPSLLVRGRCSPARVLLVDDVATTGASLARAAAVLRAAGARSVHAAVVAAVP
ncbi:MAG: phosphoribosyltransferase family protein, partial [Acidimicrobiia bacterium]|nr:phosphoribosyltransferase family protein [Acidimicrobiia bacterium]